MRCSICIATRNKAAILERTLWSIEQQQVPFEFEVIVVDDGSTDDTLNMLAKRFSTLPQLKYSRIVNTRYRNPSVARNVAYRQATGDVIICQSDDVVHHTPHTVEWLTEELVPGEFLIATVYNWNAVTSKRYQVYTGRERQLPLFFLGSLSREDLYAVGGNDEEFVNPGYDDDWFADCLIRGRKLRPRFLDHVIGYHQVHWRLNNLEQLVAPSMALYKSKVSRAEAGQILWQASGGPWKL